MNEWLLLHRLLRCPDRIRLLGNQYPRRHLKHFLLQHLVQPRLLLGIRCAGLRPVVFPVHVQHLWEVL